MSSRVGGLVGGVLGQFLILSSYQSPHYRGASAFYGIKKAFSVKELCHFEVRENTRFLYKRYTLAKFQMQFPENGLKWK